MKTAPALGCLLIALATGCEATTHPAPPAEREEGRATVVSVVDGDSLEVVLGGQRVEIRLDGINAPEPGECFHAEASAYLASMVGDRVVDLTVTGMDQFGRILAQVHLEGIQVNLEMVARGMALATTPGPGDPATLVDAEEGASAGDLGLWSPASCGEGSLPAVVIDFERSVVNPPGPDEDLLHMEEVALVNRSDQRVDLTGWVLRDESSRHRFHFPSGSAIEPGEIVLVTSADTGWSPGGSPVWNNRGDLILLLDESGRVVARVRY